MGVPLQQQQALMLQKWGWSGWSGCVHSGASYSREGHVDRDATFLILVGLQAAASSATTDRFCRCSCSPSTLPSRE